MSLDPSGSAPAAPKAAATVVLLRPGPGGLEVLLTRRPSSMRFGANLFVFPGGRLDPGERPRDAAVREAAEETGIELDPEALVPMTRWVTPPSLPIRYDTRFFGTVVDPATDVVRPSAEVVEWRWLRPAAALEAMAAARMAMWQPTVVTLQQVEPVVDRETLPAAFRPEPGAAPPDAAPPDAAPPGDAAPDDPWLGLPGGRPFEHRWAGGIDGRLGRTVVVGEEAWVVVDPGDPTGETTDAIAAAAEAAGVALAGIVVTDLDPDRHAGVEMFATGLGLPVAGPPGASGLVPYAVRELGDGGRVPFGDAGLAARVVRPAAPSGPGAWAARAGRIRLVADRAAPARA